VNHYLPDDLQTPGPLGAHRHVTHGRRPAAAAGRDRPGARGGQF
jgi:hypothetical protein